MAFFRLIVINVLPAMTFRTELDAALGIARRAGELALSYFSQGTPAEVKPDLSPVTAADRECEKLITRLITDNFPEDGILGEEGAFRPSRTGRRWLIDPIDGTRDFVRQTSFWAVQIALEEEGRIVLGVVHLPCFNETVYASKGAGCFFNGVRTRAAQIQRVEDSILMVSGFKSAWKAWNPDAIRRLSERCWTVRSYSGCYDVALLARGKADIWLSGSGMEWDYAPARIIAQECGAKFFTRDGTDRIDASHCLICAPGLESELRQILGVHPPIF